MATERLAPDVLLVQSQLTGAVTDIDDDPDSPDGLWLTASGNNTSVELHASFPAPSGNLTVGSNLQQLKVWVRQFDEGQSGTPQVRVELWEAGSLVRADIATNVNDGGTLRLFNWNASELAAVSGVDVEIKVFGIKTGGSPGTRNTVEIGAVEWNVDYSSGETVGADLYVDPDSFGATQVNQGIVADLLADGEAFGAAQVNRTELGTLLVDGESFGAAQVNQTAIVGAVLVDGESFGAATVHQTVIGSALADGETFGAATVHQTVVGALFVDPDTFPEATVDTGQTVVGALFVDPDSFGAAQVNIAAVASLLTDGESFGSAQVNRTEFATLLVDGESFGAPQVDLVVPGILLVDGESFPEATVTTGQTVAGTLLVDGETFGAPIVHLVVPGTLLGDGESFPEPTVVTAQTVAADLYVDSDSFGATQVNLAIIGTALVDSDGFGAAQVNRTEFGTLLVDGESFGAATVARAVVAALFVDADSFGAPTVHLIVPGLVFVDPDVFPEATVLSGGPTIVAGELHENVNRFGLTMVHLDVIGTALVDGENFGAAVVQLVVLASTLVDPESFVEPQVIEGTLVRHRFSVLGDTANDAVNSGDFAAEYAASSIAAAIQFIDVAGDVLDIWTVGALTTADEATLATLVSNHQGADVDSHDAHITIVIVLDAVTITEDSTWQDLGAAVLISSEFGQIANMRVYARLEAKCDDGPSAELAQLRLVDDDGTVVTQLQTTPFDIADSTDWAHVAFESDVSPIDAALPHRLRLEGRLNGSTSASVQRSNLSLVELR